MSKIKRGYYKKSQVTELQLAVKNVTKHKNAILATNKQPCICSYTAT